MQPFVRTAFLFAPVIVASWMLATPASFAQESDSSDSREQVKIEPYTGPPLFLDEPEPQPDATLVGKVVDTQKYADGKVRVEREIAKYSDNHLVAEGFYREFYPNGEKFAEGQYEKGRQTGKWTYYHDNGKVARTVSYVNGQPDGEWEIFNVDGIVTAKRGYKEGKRAGTWVVYDKEGKQPLREESYADGMADGTWKVWFPNGQLQTEMNFSAGKRQGPTIIFDDKGTKRAEVNYDDNALDGTATLWALDGKKVTQEYENGKLVGEKRD
jgi:antitoxin component YwqK of YwqJK toxin-antitoxin module